jgi:hypothetical protein
MIGESTIDELSHHSFSFLVGDGNWGVVSLLLNAKITSVIIGGDNISTRIKKFI